MAERVGVELEPFCGRERVAEGDEWEPAGEILREAKDLTRANPPPADIGEDEGLHYPCCNAKLLAVRTR